MIHSSVGEIRQSSASTWSGPFDPNYKKGNGILAEGTVADLRNHTITDGNGKKFQFISIVLKIKSARERRFDEKGQEIAADSQAHTKKAAGYLNKFKDVAADKLELTNQQLARKLPDAVDRDNFSFYGEPNMCRKVDLKKGESVRLKTKGDTQFVETVVRLEENLIGRGEYHGESFVGQLQTMSKSQETTGSAEPKNENLDFERDADEWDDSD